MLLEQCEVGREILKRRDLSPKICLQILFKCLLVSEIIPVQCDSQKNPGKKQSLKSRVVVAVAGRIKFEIPFQ